MTKINLSDFMVDVFVFKGEFNPASLVTDPVYKDYFTSTGLLKNKFDAFANLRQVSLMAQYTGSLIPNFKDLEGRNLYIETIINSEARRTGLFCAVDEDNVQEETGTNVDLVGHVFDKDQNYELLSYVIDQTLNPTAGTTVSISGLGTVEEDVSNAITLPTLTSSAISVSSNNLKIYSASNLTSSFNAGTYILAQNGDWLPVVSVSYVNDPEPYTQVLTGAGSTIASAYALLTSGDTFDVGSLILATAELGVGANANKLYINNYDASSLVNVGEFLEAADSGEFVEITGVAYSSGTNVTTITCEDDI